MWQQALKVVIYKETNFSDLEVVMSFHEWQGHRKSYGSLRWNTVETQQLEISDTPKHVVSE